MVYLDAGTTSYEIARALGDQASLTVLTNDFTIAAADAPQPHHAISYGWQSR